LMAGVLASVAAYETEVRKERQLAGIAKAEGKRWGSRRAGTRVRLTEEKEALILGKEGDGAARLVPHPAVYRAGATDSIEADTANIEARSSA
jgi:hypothetical protein